MTENVGWMGFTNRILDAYDALDLQEIFKCK